MNTHDKEQRCIEIIQRAFCVLGLLVQHQHRTERGTFVDGLRWTAWAISRHLRMDISRLFDALSWLLHRRYVEQRMGEWFITIEGTEAYAEEIKSPWLQTGASVKRFREEALSGMTEAGKQSEFNTAALPSSGFGAHSPDNREEDTAIEICSQIDRIRAIAAKLRLDEHETATGMATGRVGRCKGINLVEPHWGVFDKHGGKGGRWQSLCRECRKISRKISRKNKT